MDGVQHLEYCFWKEIFSLPRAVSMYGLQHSEFALGKKKFLTQNSFYVWYMTFRILLSERKKLFFLFLYAILCRNCRFFWTPRVPISVNPLPPFIDDGTMLPTMTYFVGFGNLAIGAFVHYERKNTHNIAVPVGEI